MKIVSAEAVAEATRAIMCTLFSSLCKQLLLVTTKKEPYSWYQTTRENLWKVKFYEDYDKWLSITGDIIDKLSDRVV